ncbi:conserved hypothetical protein [Vibrio cholerae O1 str. 2010EL-1786]|uniref:Uncharacterized protein n=3 Tax=Vibrio cholerae TaxID=666 RepID=Q9KPN5_VIBCH|nr:hypothetical protein VC_2331 [Vibrio cholerae O1 biovar El Tor str. N16961]ACP06555.1 conserved hypothetical protein [Vibrio cholerae M66-2]ACP10436.1 conserved hypothetical protein [Vibrio cholerae O395]AET27413.1 conserved hypothetical protein [Vibrio cholerae O1 str. 2010EL-1786]EET23571.1 conserved hypothetical protein [Vibrio cholerae MO10]CSI55803.1 Uncharacterised protein [Vibrio cholerae]
MTRFFGVIMTFPFSSLLILNMNYLGLVCAHHWFGL